MARHRRGKSLRNSNCLHDTVLDRHDQALLLLRAGTDTNSGEELPDVDILASIDRAREDVREGRLEGIEEAIVGVDPDEG